MRLKEKMIKNAILSLNQRMVTILIFIKIKKIKKKIFTINQYYILGKNAHLNFGNQKKQLKTVFSSKFINLELKDQKKSEEKDL